MLPSWNKKSERVFAQTSRASHQRSRVGRLVRSMLTWYEEISSGKMRFSFCKDWDILVQEESADIFLHRLVSPNIKCSRIRYPGRSLQLSVKPYSSPMKIIPPTNSHQEGELGHGTQRTTIHPVTTPNYPHEKNCRSTWRDKPGNAILLLHKNAPNPISDFLIYTLPK